MGDGSVISRARRRVAILSTFDNIGGAGRAAYRLFKALRELGRVDVDMYVARPWNSENVKLWPNSDVRFVFERIIEKYFIEKNRTPVSNTMFSLTGKGKTMPQIDWTQYDAINLHWVERFFSYRDFQHLAASGLPIIWTLHDMRVFTGGCHYSFGCTRYQDDCMPCSQLRFDPLSLARRQLSKRMRIFADAEITGIAPSNWIAELAQRSRFLLDRSIHVIRNSLELDTFLPINKHDARQQLGLPEDAFLILCGAHDGTEKRKGLSLLAEALKQCYLNDYFRHSCEKKKLVVVTLGIPDRTLTELPLPVTNLGFIKTAEQLAAVYSAADIFFLPSLYDNLPNTMLESLACGTPVVSFNVGGMPEILGQDCGFLVPAYSASGFANTILRLIKHPKELAEAAQNCRSVAVRNFSPQKQAVAYLELFERTIKTH